MILLSYLFRSFIWTENPQSEIFLRCQEKALIAFVDKIPALSIA